MIFDLTKRNYQNVTPEGQFVKLPPGGYVCEVKRVEFDNAADGRQKIVLCLDICEGEHEGYFSKKIGAEGKWDFNAQFQRCILDAETGNYTRGFKRIITIFEANNPDVNASANFNSDVLIGKKCGAVFGEKEYSDKYGFIRTTTKISWLCHIQDVHDGTVKIPPIEKLKDKGKGATNSADIDRFNGTDVNDEDVPF